MDVIIVKWTSDGSKVTVSELRDWKGKVFIFDDLELHDWICEEFGYEGKGAGIQTYLGWLDYSQRRNIDRS